MSLDTLIADTRKAIADDAVNAHCPVLNLFQNPVPASRTLITPGYLASGG
jgi:hypothetical protein